MKKIIIIMIMMLVLMCSFVSAGNYVDDFLGIHYGPKETITTNTTINETVTVEDLCTGDFYFKQEIQSINSDNISLEFVSVFDDGYHVVSFPKGGFWDNDYYTAFIDDGKIKWVKSGICSEKYDLYTVDYDVNNIYSELEEENNDFMKVGRRVYSNIKGISIFQKIQIFSKIASLGTKI